MDLPVPSISIFADIDLAVLQLMACDVFFMLVTLIVKLHLEQFSNLYCLVMATSPFR